MSQELLTETLTSMDEAAKHAYIGHIINEYTMGWGMVDELRAYIYGLPSSELAEHVIGGLTKKDVELDWDRLTKKSALAAVTEDETFILPPLPNTLFTRDSSCWIYNGVSINPMYYPARRLESINIEVIYRGHPMFRGSEIRTIGIRP